MKSMAILLDETALASNARRRWCKPLILQDNLQSRQMIENQRGVALAGDAGCMGPASSKFGGTGLFGNVDLVEAGGTRGTARAGHGAKARADARGTSPKRPPAPLTGASVLTPIAFFAFAARQVVFLAQRFDAAKGSGGARLFSPRLLLASCGGRGEGDRKGLAVYRVAFSGAQRKVWRQAANADPAFLWPSAARLSTGGGRGASHLNRAQAEVLA